MQLYTLTLFPVNGIKDDKNKAHKLIIQTNYMLRLISLYMLSDLSLLSI